MKKIKNDYKTWKVRHDKKVHEYNVKRKNKIRKDKAIKKVSTSKDNGLSGVYNLSFDLPTVFSIVDNYEETIKLFDEILSKVKSNSKFAKVLYVTFNMKNIKAVTSDALMYLLTIIRNIKINDNIMIVFRGNLPINKEAKKFVNESGFLNYLHTKSDYLNYETDDVKIFSGNNWYSEFDKKTDIRVKVIDYTASKLKDSKSNIQFLTGILTELITNKMDHAYDFRNPIFEPYWYMFIKDEVDKITYTFMDNGLGIPTTVKKKWYEVRNNDIMYLEDSLKGKTNRTQTKKANRGNGLPTIYEYYKNNLISNFTVVTNKAFFKENRGSLMENEFQGTLFYFEIQKMEDKNGN